MTTPELNKHVIYSIIEDARFAPSVHNTQPWKVNYRDNIIYVSPDPDHTLKDGDPTGRQTVISLGIFTQSIVYCAGTQGLTATKIHYDGNKAAISFQDSESTLHPDYVALLHSRATDRSIYKPTMIEPSHIDTIKQSGAAPNIAVEVRLDDEFKNKVSELTAKGIGLALSSPAFRFELANYLLPPWTYQKRGISLRSLYIPLFKAILEPTSLRLGVGIHKEAKLEKKRWDSASAIICITSSGDMPKDWFAVGQAYLRIALAVEKLGLSQATSAALVEASTFHEDIEEMLMTKHRLQAVIRIGKGVKHRVYSPRVDTADIVIT